MAGPAPASDDPVSTTLLVNPSPAQLGVTNAVLWGRGSGGHHVRGYPGPLSLKAVLRGRGVWETDEGRHTVDAGSWLVLNDGHAYSLTIERGQPVETFCIFFARGYVEATRASLVRPPDQLLDDPGAALEPHPFREVPRPYGLPVTVELLALREALHRSEEPLAVEARLLSLSRAERHLSGNSACVAFWPTAEIQLTLSVHVDRPTSTRPPDRRLQTGQWRP